MLRISKALPLLEQEITSFRSHAKPSGKLGFDAAPGEHDDLISSIAIPLIIGEWRFRFVETIKIDPADIGVRYYESIPSGDGFSMSNTSNGFEPGIRYY